MRGRRHYPAAAAGSMPTVAVVGGSLGGLNAALELLEAGCDVHVYERSPHQLSSRGAGIVVQPDTVSYLQAHGTPISAISTSTASRVYLTPDGRTLNQMPGEQRFTSWNTLYRHLLAALPPNRYHLACEATRVEQAGGRVTLTLAPGRTVTVDLLVAADGPRSTVRAGLLPTVAPRYAGYVAWRGLVPEDAVPAAVAARFADTFVFAELPRSHALCYPIPGPAGQLAPGLRLLNWLWYRTVPDGAPLEQVVTGRDGTRHTSSLPPGAVHPAQLDRLRADAADLLPPDFAAVVSATGEPFLQPIVDLSVPRMVFGRVALLGDAAFVPRPHTAGSTMKAAFNGRALADALAATYGDAPAALARWEPAQLSIGHELERQGQRLAHSAGLGR